MWAQVDPIKVKVNFLLGNLGEALGNQGHFSNSLTNFPSHIGGGNPLGPSYFLKGLPFNPGFKFFSKILWD